MMPTAVMADTAIRRALGAVNAPREPIAIADATTAAPMFARIVKKPRKRHRPGPAPIFPIRIKACKASAAHPTKADRAATARTFRLMSRPLARSDSKVPGQHNYSGAERKSDDLRNPNRYRCIFAAKVNKKV